MGTTTLDPDSRTKYGNYAAQRKQFHPKPKPKVDENQLREHPVQNESGFAPPTSDELGDALMVLLDALIEHREHSRTIATSFECYSLGKLMATSEDTLRALEIVEDPIEHALKTCLKETAHLLGQHLTLDEIAAKVDRQLDIDARRYAPLDWAFDNARCKCGGLYLK